MRYCLTKVNGRSRATIYSGQYVKLPEGQKVAPSFEELTKRKQELVQRLQSIRSDLARGLAADSEEQAMQLENLDVLQEIHRLADEELQTVEKALAKASPEG
jgi:hypothetical protein